MIKKFINMPPALTAIIWQIVAVGTVLLVLRYLNDGNLSFFDAEMRPIFLFIGCYFLALVIVFFVSKTRFKSLVFGPAVYAALSSIVLLAIIVFSFQYSRLDIVVAFGLLGFLSFIYPLFSGARVISFLILCVVSIGVVLLPQSGVDLLSPTLKISDYSQSRFSSALYNLEIRKYQNVVPRQSKHTAMAAIGRYQDTYVLVMANGEIYSVSNLGTDEAIETTLWVDRVPVNHEEFLADASSSSYLPYFRALDVLIRKTGTSNQMLVSHHYWNRELQCATLRVSYIVFEDMDNIELGNVIWKKLFETTPCLSLQPVPWAFRGMEGGGRLALYNSENVLLTVGDHGMNGVDFDENFVDVPSASYGKTLRINLNDGLAEVFSTGHRNQQGLYVDENNRVWSTEHGPKGGDELNQLEAGGFYGWPKITYGTDYGKLIWPLKAPRDQSKYTLPIFSWVPSIGVSSLAGIESRSLFPLWNGDLLIGSLVGQTLFRARMEDGVVRYIEPMPFDERIRDIHIDENGIILWTDSRSLIQILPSSN